MRKSGVRTCYPLDLGGEEWSGREDLNLRPPAPKAGALPGCATPRLLIKILLDYSRAVGQSDATEPIRPRGDGV